MVTLDKDALMDLLKQTYDAGYNDGYANVGNFDDYCEREVIEELLELLAN